MTRRQARSRLHFWVRRFGLQTYDYTVTWGADIDAQHEAEVLVHDDYEEVDLKYSRDWSKWDCRKFDAVTVHELLHVVFHDQKVAVESIYDNLSHDARVMLKRRFAHETEHAVERLAQRIVDIERGTTR